MVHLSYKTLGRHHFNLLFYQKFKYRSAILDLCIVNRVFTKQWLFNIESMNLLKNSIFFWKGYMVSLWSCLNFLIKTRFIQTQLTCSQYVLNSKSHMMDWNHHIQNNPNKHFNSLKTIICLFSLLIHQIISLITITLWWHFHKIEDCANLRFNYLFILNPLYWFIL